MLLVKADAIPQDQLQTSNYPKLGEYSCRKLEFESKNGDPLNYHIDVYGYKSEDSSQSYFPFLQKYVKIYQNNNFISEFFAFDNYGGRLLNFDKDGNRGILNWGKQEFYRFESIDIGGERGQFIFLAPGHTLFCNLNDRFRIDQNIYFEVRRDIVPPNPIPNFDDRKDRN